MAVAATSASRRHRRCDGLVLGVISENARTAVRIERALARPAGGFAIKQLSIDGRSRTTPDLDLDVLILDFADGEARATEVLPAARSALGRVPTVAVWPNACHDPRRPLRRLGLDGVVLVGDLETTLGPTVRAVSAGLVCVPRVLRAELQRENLSGREKQVLGMVVAGSTNGEIAARLFLAESTVKSHLSSAYEKLGVRSREAAAALILDPTLGLDRGILAISAA